MELQKKFESKSTVFRTREEKAWRQECKRLSLPFIVIRYKPHYADISWDTDTFTFNHFEALSDSIKSVRKSILAQCEPYRHLYFDFYFSADFGFLNNVPVQYAEQTASIIFDSLYDASRRIEHRRVNRQSRERFRAGKPDRPSHFCPIKRSNKRGGRAASAVDQRAQKKLMPIHDATDPIRDSTAKEPPPILLTSTRFPRVNCFTADRPAWSRLSKSGRTQGLLSRSSRNRDRYRPTPDRRSCRFQTRSSR